MISIWYFLKNKNKSIIYLTDVVIFHKWCCISWLMLLYFMNDVVFHDWCCYISWLMLLYFMTDVVIFHKWCCISWLMLLCFINDVVFHKWCYISGEGCHIIQTDQVEEISDIISNASVGKSIPLIKRQTSKRSKLQQSVYEYYLVIITYRILHEYSVRTI